MNVLFIGDVCGKPGRRILKLSLQQLVKKTNAEVVIVNGENSAHGKGITSSIYQEFIKLNIDCVTLGNHAFSKREIMDSIECLDKLVRPLNMNPTEIGKSSLELQTTQGKLIVVSVYGLAFMNNTSQDPFVTFEDFLSDKDDELIFVDYHGEATAEKRSFYHKFKDRCIAIVGTHTHVQTCDNQIECGCAYISDVGMTGVIKSILGRDIQEVLSNLEGNPTFYTVASGKAMLNAVLISVENKQAVDMKVLQVIENDRDDLIFFEIDKRKF